MARRPLLRDRECGKIIHGSRLLCLRPSLRRCAILLNGRSHPGGEARPGSAMIAGELVDQPEGAMKLHLPLSVWPMLLACTLCATITETVPISRLEIRVLTVAPECVAASG